MNIASPARKRLLFAAPALAVLFALPFAVRADKSDHVEARELLKRGEILPLSAILDAAARRVEGDVIERVCAIAGPKCVIGVELDPHCHMTLKRVRLADVIVCYKEFPHTDVVERAEDVLDIVLRTLRGEAKPVMSLYDCRQIGSYPTTLPLMRGFVDIAAEFQPAKPTPSIARFLRPG